MVDVVGALKSPTTIDRSVIVDINGEEVLLCACTSWWPQQANSGIGCRFCYIGPDEYGGVNFDFHYISNGRYHRSLPCVRIWNLFIQRTVCNVGTSPEPSALAQISPALDTLISGAGDPALSEYKRLKLLDTVLTTPATRSYAACGLVV
jgi:hypothetical protein